MFAFVPLFPDPDRSGVPSAARMTDRKSPASMFVGVPALELSDSSGMDDVWTETRFRS